MKIVIIDNYDSFTYNLSHLVKELGAEVTVLRNDQFQLDDLEEFDKIILSPGPGIPSEAGLLLDVIRTYSDKKPILGVCLGHQAIGEAFGAQLENLSDVFHGVASPCHIDRRDLIFRSLPETITVGRYHSWVVSYESFPACLEITAWSDEGQIMALRHKELNIHGIQFHPEAVLTPYSTDTGDNHEDLTREEMKTVLIGITHSEYPNEQITALLTALQMKGVTVDELLGFRDGILETGVPAILDCDRYIDVVGTGGDRKNTFNISTTACFVIAGAGYKVAKHGNYAATSVSGASNVIQHHGIKFTDNIDHLNRSLNETGIVYLHAQLFAKAMKFVGPIRKALQFPTIFNLLGPIVNPSQPKCQLLGVANLDQMRLYNNVYQRIGIDYGIVNSIDGYDEISLTGNFKVTTNNYERIFKPQDLGFDIAKPEELVGGASEEEAAQIFDAVLENRALPAQKNIVLANAAFGIQVLEKGQKDIEECSTIARESIDSGSALRTFKKFAELNS